MANQTLKTYEVKVVANLDEALKHLSSLEEKMSKGTGITEAMKSEFEQVTKVVKGITGQITAESNKIQGQINEINTKELQQEFKDMTKTINDSVSTLGIKMGEMKSMIEKLEKGEISKITEGISASFEIMSNSIKDAVSSMSDTTNVLQNILSGAIDVSKLGKDGKKVEETVGNVTDTLEDYIDDLQKTLKDNKIELFDAASIKRQKKEIQLQIRGYINTILAEFKKLKDNGYLSNAQYSLTSMLGISSTDLNSINAELAQKKPRKEKYDKNNNKEIVRPIKVTYDVDVNNKEAVDKIVESINTVIRNVEKDIESVKIPIGYTLDEGVIDENDKKALERAQKSSLEKNLIRHINLDIKADSSTLFEEINTEVEKLNEDLAKKGKKIEIGVVGKVDQKVAEESARQLATEIEDAQLRGAGDINVRGGNIVLDASNGIASESTLSKIEGILSGWDVTGIPGTQSEEFKKQLKAKEIASATVDDIKKNFINTRYGNRLTKKEQNENDTTDMLLSKLIYKDDYHSALSEVIGGATGRKIRKGDFSALESSRIYSEYYEKDGKKYAKFADPDKGFILLDEWQAELKKKFEASFDPNSKESLFNIKAKKFQVFNDDGSPKTIKKKITDEVTGRIQEIEELVYEEVKIDGYFAQQRKQVNNQKKSLRDSLKNNGVQFRQEVQRDKNGNIVYDDRGQIKKGKYTLEILDEKRTVTSNEDALTKSKAIAQTIKNEAQEEYELYVNMTNEFKEQLSLITKIKELQGKSDISDDEKIQLDSLKNQLVQRLEGKVLSEENRKKYDELSQKKALLIQKRLEGELDNKSLKEYLSIDSEIQSLYGGVEDVDKYIETMAPQLVGIIDDLEEKAQKVVKNAQKEIREIYKPTPSPTEYEVTHPKDAKKLFKRYDNTTVVPITNEQQYHAYQTKLEELKKENAQFLPLIAQGNGKFDYDALGTAEKSIYFENLSHIKNLQTQVTLYEEANNLASDLLNTTKKINSEQKVSFNNINVPQKEKEDFEKLWYKRNEKTSGIKDEKEQNIAFLESLSDEELEVAISSGERVLTAANEQTAKTNKQIQEEVKKDIAKSIEFLQKELEKEEKKMADIVPGSKRAENQQYIIDSIKNNIIQLEGNDGTSSLEKHREELRKIEAEESGLISSLKEKVKLEEYQIEDVSKLWQLKKKLNEEDSKLKNLNVEAWNHYTVNPSKMESPKGLADSIDWDHKLNFWELEDATDELNEQVQAYQSAKHAYKEFYSELENQRPDVLKLAENPMFSPESQIMEQIVEYEERRNAEIDAILDIQTRRHGYNNKEKDKRQKAYVENTLGGPAKGTKTAFDPFDTSLDKDSVYDARVKQLSEKYKIQDVSTVQSFLEAAEKEKKAREEAVKHTQEIYETEKQIVEKRQEEIKLSEKKRNIQQVETLNQLADDYATKIDESQKALSDIDVKAIEQSYDEVINSANEKLIARQQELAQTIGKNSEKIYKPYDYESELKGNEKYIDLSNKLVASQEKFKELLLERNRLEQKVGSAKSEKQRKIYAQDLLNINSAIIEHQQNQILIEKELDSIRKNSNEYVSLNYKLNEEESKRNDLLQERRKLVSDKENNNKPAIANLDVQIEKQERIISQLNEQLKPYQEKIAMEKLASKNAEDEIKSKERLVQLAEQEVEKVKKEKQEKLEQAKIDKENLKTQIAIDKILHNYYLDEASGNNLKEDNVYFNDLDNEDRTYNSRVKEIDGEIKQITQNSESHLINLRNQEEEISHNRLRRAEELIKLENRINRLQQEGMNLTRKENETDEQFTERLFARQTALDNISQTQERYIQLQEENLNKTKLEEEILKQISIDRANLEQKYGASIYSTEATGTDKIISNELKKENSYLNSEDTILAERKRREELIASKQAEIDAIKIHKTRKEAIKELTKTITELREEDARLTALENKKLSETSTDLFKQNIEDNNLKVQAERRTKIQQLESELLIAERSHKDYKAENAQLLIDKEKELNPLKEENIASTKMLKSLTETNSKLIREQNKLQNKQTDSKLNEEELNRLRAIGQEIDSNSRKIDELRQKEKIRLVEISKKESELNIIKRFGNKYKDPNQDKVTQLTKDLDKVKADNIEKTEIENRRLEQISFETRTRLDLEKELVDLQQEKLDLVQKLEKVQNKRNLAETEIRKAEKEVQQIRLSNLQNQEIKSFQKGMSKEQRAASLGVDLELLTIQRKKEELATLNKSETRYKELQNEISDCNKVLEIFKQEAKEAGLTLSETTGRMYLNEKYKDTALSGLTINKTKEKVAIPTYADNTKEVAEHNKVLLQSYHYHSDIVDEVKEETAEQSRLTKMWRFAGMTDREAELTNEIKKVNSQLKNNKKLTDEQRKAYEEKLKVLHKTVELETRQGKIALKINKNGYIDPKVGRSEFVVNPEAYATNKYIKQMLNSPTASYSEKYIENYRLATESTLQNIQKILLTGVNVKVIKGYKDKGKLQHFGLNDLPNIDLDKPFIVDEKKNKKDNNGIFNTKGYQEVAKSLGLLQKSKDGSLFVKKKDRNKVYSEMDRLGIARYLEEDTKATKNNINAKKESKKAVDKDTDATNKNNKIKRERGKDFGDGAKYINSDISVARKQLSRKNLSDVSRDKWQSILDSATAEAEKRGYKKDAQGFFKSEQKKQKVAEVISDKTIEDTEQKVNLIVSKVQEMYERINALEHKKGRKSKAEIQELKELRDMLPIAEVKGDKTNISSPIKDTFDTDGTASKLKQEGKQAGEEFGKAIEEGAKDSLGINSPSTIFQEIAHWCGEGAKIGLDKEGKVIYGKVSDWKEKLLAAFKDEKITIADLVSFKDSNQFDGRSSIAKAVNEIINEKLLPERKFTPAVQEIINKGVENLSKKELESKIKTAESNINGEKSTAKDWEYILPKLKTQLEKVTQAQEELTQSFLDYRDSFGSEYEFVLDQLEKAELTIGKIHNLSRRTTDGVTTGYDIKGQYGNASVNLTEEGWLVKGKEQIVRNLEEYKELEKQIKKMQGEKFDLLSIADPEMFGQFGKEIDNAKEQLTELQLILENGYNGESLEEIKTKIANVNDVASKLKGNLRVGESEDIGTIDKTRLNEVRQQLEALAHSTSKGTVEIGKFDNVNQELTYTVRTTDNMLQTYTISMDKYSGKLTKTFASETKYLSSFQKALQGLGNKFQEIFRYTIASVSIHEVWQFLKQGVNVVKEMDTAMTELRKVSNETEHALQSFRKEAFKIADEVGSTGKEIVNSAADWQRLGYTIKESAKLAKNTAIYSNVGNMDIDTATEHMISSIKAWESEFDNEVETSEAIVDKYNEIGNNFAISSAEIGEAMERSAAALKAGGNTLDESLGIIVAGNVIQQDAETTAAALKILSLRIRGAKTDLENMGESTDGLASSTSKMREEIKALSGVDIMLDNNTFKSTTEIIKELGAVYNDMSDVSQAALLEKIAGKNRASTIEGLLQNYKLIDEVMESAANSQGSAVKENEKYKNSIQGHLDILTNKWQEMWDVTINSEVINFFIDLGGTVLDLVKNAGLLKTLLIGGSGIFAAVKSFKGEGRAKCRPINEYAFGEFNSDVYELYIV